MLFKGGTFCITRAVNEKTADDVEFAKFVHSSLMRHMSGDWGEISVEDKEANQEALAAGLRLFSAYEKEGMPKIWIITEADRSSTCVLFPEDY